MQKAAVETMSVAQRIQAARPQMAAIKEKYDSARAQLVYLRDAIFEILLAFKLMYYATINCMQIGTHPSNRGDNMIEPQDIPKKLKNFVKYGVSADEMKRACVLARPEGQKGNEYEEKNITCVQKASGQLAPVAPGSLRYFTITCGHTNQSMRACVCCCIGNNDPEISQNGVISKAVVSEKCPNFGDMCDNGIPWKVIFAEVEDEWQWALDIIMDADNITYQMARSDSVFEVQMKIVRVARSIREPETQNVDWDEVQRRILQTEIKRSDDIQDLTTFVRYNSGGLDDPIILKEIDAKVKLMKNGYTEPNTQVLAKMQVFDEFPPNMLVHWRAAVVKTMITSGDKNRKGESKYFSTGDISDMLGKYKDYMLQADELMSKVCRCLNGANETHIYICQIHTTMDVHVYIWFSFQGIEAPI